jgi:hypothetical protein
LLLGEAVFPLNDLSYCTLAKFKLVGVAGLFIIELKDISVVVLENEVCFRPPMKS